MNGPDTSQLAPADAVVALRSFPRRFRELFVLEDDEDPAVLEPALEHLRAAVAELADLPVGAETPEAALDLLELQANDLADRTAKVTADEWRKDPERLDALRETVRKVASHLYAAEVGRFGAG